jgi:phosphoribosyl-ATP pyrophosphohydrolase/phosphoribosyl-AMP cyclohydrolase
VTTSNLTFLATLEAIIADRLENPTQESYTASLIALGPKRVAQKVGEEAVEVALATVDGDREEVINEAADLIYHLLVLLNSQGIQLSDVTAVLESRHTG